MDPWATVNNLGLLYDPMRVFFSHRWNVGTNPDVAFASRVPATTTDCLTDESTKLINKRLSDQWKVPTPEENNISGPFRPEELAATLRRLKPESLRDWILFSRSLYYPPC